MVVFGEKIGFDFVFGCLFEVPDFRFFLYDKSNGNALHSSCGKRRLYFLPKNRRNLISHYSVQNPAGLLCIDEVDVYIPRVCHCIQNGSLGNLVEDYSFCFGGIELQGFFQVPCDGFSFAVFIGCKPHHLGLPDIFFQFGNEFRLIFRNDIFRLEVMLYVYAYFLCR